MKQLFVIILFYSTSVYSFEYKTKPSLTSIDEWGGILSSSSYGYGSPWPEAQNTWRSLSSSELFQPQRRWSYGNPVKTTSPIVIKEYIVEKSIAPPQPLIIEKKVNVPVEKYIPVPIEKIVNIPIEKLVPFAVPQVIPYPVDRAVPILITADGVIIGPQGALGRVPATAPAPPTAAPTPAPAPAPAPASTAPPPAMAAVPLMFQGSAINLADLTIRIPLTQAINAPAPAPQAATQPPQMPPPPPPPSILLSDLAALKNTLGPTINLAALATQGLGANLVPVKSFLNEAPQFIHY